MSPGEAEQLLDLKAPYTREDLESAYHHALTLCHPSHFSEEEALLAEAMDQTLRIGEAYQVLTAPPPSPETQAPKKPALAFAAPALPEPKVEAVMPRILGPRLRLPQVPTDLSNAPGSLSTPRLGSSSFSNHSATRRSSPGMPLSSPPSLGSASGSGTSRRVPISRPKPKPPPAATQPSMIPWGSRWFWGVALTGLATVMALSLVFNQRSHSPGGGGGGGSGGSRPSSKSPVLSSSSSSSHRGDSDRDRRQERPKSHLEQVPPLMAEAYQRAAEQNDPPSQRELGQAYKSGVGVPKDDVQAVFWFRKAASQGDREAQRELGAAYREGRGVPQDEEQASFWHKLSLGQ